MNDERRYDEAEVDEIFRRVSEVGESAARPTGEGSGTGMTLAELQEIGEEVGFSPHSVARAAASLDVQSARAVKDRQMGLPVGVDRTVILHRDLTEVEWARLVSKLRETFRAQGKVEGMSGLRQWSNGNLRVSLEPSESGYQLKMHTHKGDLRPLLSISAAMLSVAVILVVLGVFLGGIDMAGALFMAMVGIAAGGIAVGRLPGWAERRSRQMDEIAETVSDWTALPPAGE